jgi:hypothetical protein
MRWAEYVARMGIWELRTKFLFGSLNTRRHSQDTGLNWENNIKIVIREIVSGGVDWIHLAQYSTQWQVLVNMVMKFRGNTTKNETFWDWPLLHGDVSGSQLLGNVCQFLPHYTMLHRRSLSSLYLSQWEPQISPNQSQTILKGSDDGAMHFEESCFRPLSIVQCFALKTTFRKLALLSYSGKKGGRGCTYSVGSLRKS